MAEKFFRQVTAKENLASNIDKAFLEQDWTVGNIDYAPVNLKPYMKDVLLNQVSFEHRNLKLIVACSIIIYKMLYETEENQRLFAPPNIQAIPTLNMIRSLKNEMCATYSLPVTLIGSDTAYNNLTSENKRSLMSAMYDFVYSRVKQALNLRFEKKDLTAEYKYYTTIYRYIGILLQSLLHKSQ